MTVQTIEKGIASEMVIKHHYLHRRPNISYCYGLFKDGQLFGVCTFGIPASRHLQISACRSNPNMVIELNRLWVCDSLPKNTESWFVSRALKMLPPLIVISYADSKYGHSGFIYRALNFNYAGFTDMERKTPRYDYIVVGKHTRDAFRNGQIRYTEKIRRSPKFKYWTLTGNNRDRTRLGLIVSWPRLSWKEVYPKTNVTR